MIKAIFKPHGHLYRYFPVGSSYVLPYAAMDVFNNETHLTVEVPSGTSLGSLYGDLKIPENEYITSIVNGGQENDDYVLQDGDIVEVLPTISGG